MLLQLDDVTTYYGKMRILEGINIEVDRGELVCLLGGNASGKSTTLKTILGLVRPRAGRVLIDSEDVTGRAVPDRIARGLALRSPRFWWSSCSRDRWRRFWRSRSGQLWAYGFAAARPQPSRGG